MKNDTDEQIQQILLEQSKELDALVDDSIPGYLKMGFTSGFSGLMKIAYALAIALTILIFWCGYQFITAPPEGQIFWGVWTILSFNAQVATKLWIFMQTNRNITSRELKLMEFRLTQQNSAT